MDSRAMRDCLGEPLKNKEEAQGKRDHREKDKTEKEKSIHGGGGD